LKKFLLGLMCGIVLAAATSVYAAGAVNAVLFPVKYIFNGQEKKLDGGYATLNYNGRAYVPIRFVAENMGAAVAYDENTRSIKINHTADSMQVVKTNAYSLAVPGNWTVRTVDLEPGNVYFYLDGKNIGGLAIEGYLPPDSPYFPNHSELTEKKVLDGYFTTVIRASFDRTQPAAAQDPTVTRETRFYFLIDDIRAYDLYFDREFVDETTMIRIAKSLTVH
jgi:Copper amine oxidase N-terminal domain.